MKTKITIFYYTSITSETIIWYDTYISEVNQQSVFFCTLYSTGMNMIIFRVHLLIMPSIIQLNISK